MLKLKLSTLTAPQALSPLRLMRRWIFQERALAGPGAIHLTVLERVVDRQGEALTTATATAEEIEERLAATQDHLRAALADGVVDPSEAATLTRALAGTVPLSRRHTAHLRGQL